MYYYTNNEKAEDIRLCSEMCNIIMCKSKDCDGAYIA